MNRKRTINCKPHIAQTTVLADSSVRVEIFRADKVVFRSEYNCSEEKAIALAYHQYQKKQHEKPINTPLS